MDIGNSDLHNTNSGNGTSNDINVIIDQRNRLLELLTQRDATIEQLLLKDKLDTQCYGNIPPKHRILSTRTVNQQSDGKIRVKNNIRMVSEGQLNYSAIKLEHKRNQKPVTMGFKHLSLQCRLLTDLNKSLEKEIRDLKTVNKILRNSFDILKVQLERVQSEHQLGLSQVHSASNLLRESMVNDSNKKRPAPSNGNLTSLEPQMKKRRIVDDKKDDSNRPAGNEVTANYSGSQTDEGDTNGIVNDTHEDADDDDDLILIGKEPSLVVIELDDDSETDASLESDSYSEEDADEPDSLIKPLSQYKRSSIVG